MKTGKILQIAVVDADDLRARRDGGADLVRVVRLHERGETEFVADGEILRERLRVQQRADQQHAVRAHQAGLIELVVADGEVLAQHRR